MNLIELIAIQTDIIWQDPEANVAQLRATLDAVRPAAGSLVVLPEMCACGFSMDAARTTAGEGGVSTACADMARNHGVFLMVGLAVAAGNGTAANESVTFDPDGREVARYRKLQPFTPSGEAEIYPAGDQIVTFPWQGFTVAPFICYDLRFPELFRAAVDRGADLFAVIGNWPSRRHQHWSILLRARAIENQAFTIGVNRAGADPEFTYAGGSVILGPQAEVLAEADDAVRVIRVTVSHETVAQWRTHFPALRDRRSRIPL